MGKSTSATRSKSTRPKKPYPDFPLTPHPTGRWCKKIKGKLHYFGRIDDPDAALQRYLNERDDLYAGRTPRSSRDGVTVGELCNRFLHAKATALDAGEIAPSTWKDYHLICKLIVSKLDRHGLVEDLGPETFDKFRAEIAKTGNLVTQSNSINRVRIVFRYGYEAGLIKAPVRFGANFKRPSRKSIRRQRIPRMYEASEIRRMLDAASPPMDAMLLLGVNCGFGNADVGRLPETAVDLEAGWIDYPRSKTGTDRRIPLWPETIDAIRKAIELRPAAKADDDCKLVFLTRWGKSWHKDGASYLSEQFRKFLKSTDQSARNAAEPNGEEPPKDLYRRGVGFYAMRHVFETIGGEACDQVAVDAIMGHERGDMASIYRERISDERLQKVTDTVREWLFEDASPDSPVVVPFNVVG